MFDVNEILAMLQNGETTESIAQKALDAVNEAARIQKEEEEEKQALETQAQKQKFEALDNLFVALVDYLVLFDKKTANEVEAAWDDMSDTEIEEIHKSVEGLCQMMGALQKLDGILGNDIGLVSRLGVDPKAITAQAPKKTRSDDEVIGDFLSKILG